MEQWKDIEGFEGYYQVSNYGNGKSLERDVVFHSRCGKTYVRHYKEKMLELVSASNKYKVLMLSKNNVTSYKKVHVLVAQAFLENPDPELYTEVHHINGDRADNRAENLMWMTRLEHHALHQHARAEGSKKSNSKKVYQYTLDGQLVREWSSAHEAARTLGFNRGTICDCCRSERKTYKGYKWSYVPL